MTVFVSKGDAPLSDEQMASRNQAYINRDWPEWKRERSIRTADNAFNAYMAVVAADTDTNRANNTFNWQLAEYRTATARLAQYRLADGKPAQTFSEPTGQFDEFGMEILHTWTVAAIDPLPAMVEETTYDDLGNATTAMAPNPAIVQDDAERAAAQAAVDATPLDVVSLA